MIDEADNLEDEDRESSIADFAEDYGIEYDLAEDLFDAIGGDPDSWNIPLAEDGRPDPDYMQDFADQVNIDVSDLYDMYYGYEPGGS